MSDYQDWDDWYASGNKPHIPTIATVTGGEEEIFGPIRTHQHSENANGNGTLWLAYRNDSN